jgi:hypothetical protein
MEIIRSGVDYISQSGRLSASATMLRERRLKADYAPRAMRLVSG